jgi:hypothetical protein
MHTAKLMTIAVLALLCLHVRATSAHHSFAMFDLTKNVTLEGTIKEVQWTNPHIWIQIVALDAAGKEVEWSIEGNSPNMLVRAGWTRGQLKAGDKAVMVVHPVKSGGKGHSGSLASVTVNGQRLFGGQNTNPAGKGE